MKLKKNWECMGAFLPRGNSAEWYTANLGDFRVDVENSWGDWRFRVPLLKHESLPNYSTKEIAYAEALRWLRHKLAVAFTAIDTELSELARGKNE